MLFNMGFVTQRIISSITAAVMLLTSLNCVCHGASFSSGDAGCHEQHEATTAKSYCEHDPHKSGLEQDSNHHDEQESAPCKHDGSGDHDPSCNHCQSSLVVDSSSAKNLTHLFDFSLFAPTFTTNGISAITLVQLNPHHFLGDLPPPLPDSTLLSLHCALII